jgi:hypothetical protein
MTNEKYGLGKYEDSPSEKGFLITDIENHLIIARGGDFNRLKELIVNANKYNKAKDVMARALPTLENAVFLLDMEIKDSGTNPHKLLGLSMRVNPIKSTIKDIQTLINGE